MPTTLQEKLFKDLSIRIRPLLFDDVTFHVTETLDYFLVQGSYKIGCCSLKAMHKTVKRNLVLVSMTQFGGSNELQQAKESVTNTLNNKLCSIVSAIEGRIV